MVLSRAAWPDPEEMSSLVRAAQRGEPRALDTFLATLRPVLLRYFARRLPDDSVEDLAQVALVRIARALPRIVPDQAEGYVVTVARNLLRSAYARRAREARRRVGLEAADKAASASAPDLEAEYRELALLVRRVSSAALPPPVRDVILGLLQGRTTAEIAALQRVEDVTVRTRLRRAREVLRRELEPYLDRPCHAR
jgi:RNA polymerase sigma-70 factor (ECF subfamily)